MSLVRPSASRLRASSWVAVACLATAASGQDLVIAGDGTRLVGRLVSCVGDVCVVDQQRVPRATIAWIGLGQSGNPPGQPRGAPGAGPHTAPAGASTDRLHLSDGSVVEGHVVGISLGVVATEEASYDRPAVAWIRFAGTGDAAAAPARDLLVLRDGEPVHGSLQSCAGDTCRFEARAYSRADVAWIGLEPDDAAPPVPAGEGDEVHLADGTRVAGRVHGVTATEVMAERGRWPRADVEWIHLALLTDEPPGAGGGGAGEVEPPRSDDDREDDDETEDDTDDETDDETDDTDDDDDDTDVDDDDDEDDDEDDGEEEPEEPDEEQPPPPPVPPGPGQGERGALWIGTIKGRHYGTVEGVTSDWSYDVRVRLREYRFPLQCVAGGRTERVGTYLRLEPEGSVVENRFTCHGPNFSCRGEGSTTVSALPDTAGIGHGSAIWLKTVDRDLTGCLGQAFDVPLGGGVYQTVVDVPGDRQFTVTWSNAGGESTTEAGFQTGIIGTGILRLMGLPEPPCADREVRTLAGANDVMRGSYRGPCAGCCPRMALTWSICREGADCPAAPPLPDDEAPPSREPPPDGPCDRLAALRERLGPLNERARETRRAYDEAVRRRDAARDSVWGAHGSLAGYFNAMAGFAAEFSGGLWGEVTGLASTLYDLVRNPTSSGEPLIPTPENFGQLQAQLELATNERAWQPAVREAARAAERTAEAFLAANPGDLAGAQRLYLAELKKAAGAIGTRHGALKGLSIGAAVVDYANNTQSLMDGLFGYLEARAEAAEFQSELDDLDAEILGLLEEIELLEAECAAARGGSGAGASLPAAPSLPSAARPASWSGERGRFEPALARQGDDEVADHAEVERRLGELRALQTNVELRLHEGVLPALLPFALGEWRSVDPRLLAGLLLAVGPEVEAVTADLGRLEAAGRELATLLRDLPQPAPGGAPASAAVGPGSELPPVGAAPASGVLR